MNKPPAPAAQTRFSLIVCTIGRVQELRELFESLKRQSLQDFHVILVDQSEQGQIAELAREYEQPLRIRYVKDDGVGLSRARNIGIELAEGDIIAFPDDDCTYPPNLLEDIGQRFREQSQLDGITASTNDGQGKSVVQMHRQAGRVTAFNVFRRFIEFAFFVRREALGELRFDEEFGVGAGTPWGADEGSDLVVRLVQQDAVIHFLPSLVVHHPAVPRFSAAQFAKSFRYGRGRGRLLRKHDYPHRIVIATLLRTLVGACLSLVTLRWGQACLRLARIGGTTSGYLSDAPFQASLFSADSEAQVANETYRAAQPAMLNAFPWDIELKTRISSGATWAITGRVLGITLTVAINALLARQLGTSGFGSYVVALTLVGFLSLIGTFGLHEGIVRFISERLALGQRRAAVRSVKRGLIVMAAVLAVVSPVAFWVIRRLDLGLSRNGDLTVLCVLIASIAALLAGQQLGAESLRGFHKLRSASLLSGGLSGGLLCSAIYLVLLIVYSGTQTLTLTASLVLLLVAMAVTLPVTYAIVAKVLWRDGQQKQQSRTPGEGISWQQLWAVGGSMMIVHTVAFVIQQADVWLAGNYCSSHDVGLYGSARRLTLLAAIPVQIAMLAVLSSIPDLSVRGKVKQLQSLLRVAAAVAAIPALTAIAVLLFAPQMVLVTVFGPEFRDADQLLIVLAFGLLPLILCGNPIHTLTMTGHHRAAMYVNLAAAALLLGTGMWAAREHGTMGLAWASTATLSLHSLLLWVLARMRVGVWTHVGLPTALLRRSSRHRLRASSQPAPSRRFQIPQQLGQPIAYDGRQSIHRIWWLNPSILFASLVLVTAYCAWALPAAAYRHYGMPKYFSSHYLFLSVAAVVAFLLGGCLPRLLNYSPRCLPKQVERSVAPWFVGAAVLAAIGYAAWAIVATQSGLSMSSLQRLANLADSTAADDVKANAMQTIPGVTTGTQFAVAAMLLGVWLWVRGHRWVLPVLAFLMMATLLRTVLNSERLALIELAVPAFVIWLRTYFMERPQRPLIRRTVLFAPVLAVVCGLVTFGVTESVRSWRYYRQDFDSLAEFTVWRATGYYTTAMNNGALEHQKRGIWPLPHATLQAFWDFPLIENSPVSYRSLTGLEPSEVRAETLERFGSVELNNGSGLFQPLLDYGISGFLLYWVAYGCLSAALYRAFLAGSLVGVGLYPLVYLSLLEVPRILYLPSGRALPAIVFLVAMVLVKRQQAVDVVTYSNPKDPLGRGLAGGAV